MNEPIAFACLIAIAIPSPIRAEGPEQAPQIQHVEKKADAKAMFDPIVKAYFATLAPDETEDARRKRYAVTEYEVEGLWDKLGIQLFGLSDESEGDCEYFACSNGGLKPLDVFTFGGTGIGGAVVSDGALYFTYGAGSGIHRVTLYKVARGDDHGLVHEALGIIEAQPADSVDRDVVEKARKIIQELRPVKKGESTKPALAKDGAEAARPKPVDLNRIKDKVSIMRGEESVVHLRADGDRLLVGAPGAKARPNDIAVTVIIKNTTATPFRVEGDPTRPYLILSHGFDRPLQFRMLTRLMDSKEFYEEESPLEPVKPGGRFIVKCWESGSSVEEVVLYQFALGPKAPAEPRDQGR